MEIEFWAGGRTEQADVFLSKTAISRHFFEIGVIIYALWALQVAPLAQLVRATDS